MSITVTIGSDQQILIPEADRVRCRLLEIQPNKFDSSRLNFPFELIDMEYDNEDMDDDTIATIRELSQDGFKHYESVNLPPAGEEISKRLKIYKLIKWMNGGKDIDRGEQVTLDDYQGKDYLIDFAHIDKKGGPPDFAVVMDDRGNPVQKATILKLRPAKRVARTTVTKPVAPKQVELEPDEDDPDGDLDMD